jgi:pimeloyl-ACP methyl ester carboxylesterase
VARFVLVHGAWHGGWCFDALAAELVARGQEAFAPDLPCDAVSLTPLDYARIVGPQPEAVVVGHSLGGLTIPFVPARLRVYLAAVLPLEGVFRDALCASFGGTERDGQGRSYWPDVDTAAARLYADCDRATAAWAYARLRPQAPLEPLVCPLAPDDVLVACLRDVAVDPSWQLRAGQELFERAVSLDTGHFPFLTHPGATADLLVSLAADLRLRSDC